MSDSSDELPEAAVRRLESGTFSSGLTVPDFAACLDLGLQPVGLVQGFCVMRWGWYGAGSAYIRGMNPYSSGSQSAGAYAETYRCPHGFVSSEHRMWGQNLEQTWVEEAWAEGYGSAYTRMLDEAKETGAHGVIGVVDRVTNLADTGTTEFHFLGTAIKVENGPPPVGGVPWTTYLAGQRLTKSIEAGFMPVAVVASMASVHVWAYCMTEYLMEGSRGWGGPTSPYEVEQVSKAHMAVRQLARKHVRQQLSGDTLHGARVEVVKRELAQGDEVIDCTLRGNRMRRFKDFDVVPPPTDGPTVMSGTSRTGGTGGTSGTSGTSAIDARAEMLSGARSLATTAPPNKARGVTSDLSIDEALLLHGAGWEPVDLVCGVSVVSVPVGVWTWGQGQISIASEAHNAAVRGASEQLKGECMKVHGHGVVGVRVEVEVRTHHIDVELIGTAVRPIDGGDHPASPFVSDLSARDFTLLKGAGWLPVGLAFGACFTYAPRRSAGDAMKQKTQNIELTNFTEAMYAARESAMERMQRSALDVHGQGVVGVKVTEGPMSFARHAVGFTAWGTAVRLVADAHQFVQPEVILPLDDVVVAFDAQNLRAR